MKLKLRFDKAAILDFLLQNVEKIVLGVVAIIFLLMVYSALTGIKPYKKTPEQLIQAVKAAESEVEKTPPETGLKVPDYKAQAQKSRAKIVEKPYETPVALDPAIFPKRPLRESPALYAATELRGTAEVGAFTMVVEAEAEETPAAAGARGNVGPGGGMPAARMGGSETRGQRWIVLTALVPIEKQISAFEELKNAGPHGSFDPNRDSPDYPGYWVERLELTSPGDAANPDWTKAEKVLSKTVMDKTVKQWQSVSPDVVSPAYLVEGLAFPLGPRTDAPWGKSVAHPDEIPVLENEGAGGMGAAGRAGVRMPGGMRMPGMGMPGMGMPGMPMPGMPMPGVGRTRVPRGGGMGMPGVAGGAATADPKNPFGAGDAATEENAANTNLAEEVKEPTHLLFRYFDFNVSPGKRYIYRVQLALTNPNYKLRPALLKDPKLANPPILQTKWSEPSPVIAVPTDSRILAVSVKPARASVDPSGKIVVTKWSKKKGIEAWEEFPVVRGLLANFSDKTFTPATGTGRPVGGIGMPMGPGGMGRAMMPGGMNGLMGLEGVAGKKAKGADAAAKKAEAAAKKAAKKAKADNKDVPGAGMFGGPIVGTNTVNTNAFKVNYFSHAVVVDFRGGEVLPGRKGNSLKVTSGGDILLIDADGNLVVCNELDDEAARKSLRSAETEKKEMENAAAAGAGGGMAPGGMMGMPGGGLEGMMKAGGAQPRKK